MNQAPIVLAHEQAFRIGAAEVRPATREIVHNGTANIVEPRVMQILVALHRAGGGVVSKDDLIKLCWDGRIVGDDAINRVISRLRNVADQAGNDFRIETITKVGYRLVTDRDSEVVPASRSKMINRRQAVAMGAAAVVAAGGVGWTMFGPQRLPKRAAELLETGRAAMLEGTVDKYANAAAAFREAAQIAPDSSEVWGALAIAYARQVDFSSSQQRPNLRARSLAAADKALSIDADNGDAIAAKVHAIPVYGNWHQFEIENRKALRRQPNHVMLNAMLAALLTQVGRNRDALEFLDRAVAIEPNAPRLQFVRSQILWDLGRLDEADAAIEQAFKTWPRHYVVWFGRYYFLAFNGRAPEALAMINDSASRPLGIPDWNFDLSRMQAEAADRRDNATIDKAMKAWLEVAPRGTGFAESATMFAGAMGRPDEAFKVLNAYYFNRGFAVGEQRFTKEQGMFTAPVARHTYFLFRGIMAPVQRDARFAPLAEEIRLADYWRRSATRPDFMA